MEEWDRVLAIPISLASAGVKCNSSSFSIYTYLLRLGSEVVGVFVSHAVFGSLALFCVNPVGSSWW